MSRQYVFPHPWDYHRQAALVVIADNIAEARTIAQRWHAEHCREDWITEGPCDRLDVLHPRIIRGSVYEDRGCDC
jgi:hypothetical protein